MKKEIRKNMILLRNSYDEKILDEISTKITDNIFDWQIFKDSKVVMLYSSIKSEVRTKKIIIKALEDLKVVALPKTLKDIGQIIACSINDMNGLSIGTYGTLEPNDTKIIDKNDIDIVFVPGVAFDYKGFRIGYGAGYYDRYLKDYDGIKIGVCYGFQLIDDVFHDEHDIKMDYLVTEKGIIKIGDI
ncbi:5-formyltetrahydrofolate cyclo-ligase [Caloramator sp. E03]|uniref:5-formyltetrahydrofolate cyclo-ligase n=1 Tax=Caloramator sp. E03 TaxID=2576307 RepID=UPI00143E0633|nr:5-formyltetrahydrofolate cyclo-ligase [Caloramator sp. E03]